MSLPPSLLPSFLPSFLPACLPACLPAGDTEFADEILTRKNNYVPILTTKYSADLEHQT